MKCITFLLVSLVIFSSSAIAQSISGKVVDQNGNPKQGVAVVLENMHGQSVNVTATRNSGMFDLGGIPIGDYILKIFSGKVILGASKVTVSGKSGTKAPHKLDMGTIVVK